MQVTRKYAPGVTTWRIAGMLPGASDGLSASYATLAALKAAGDVAYPALSNQGLHPVAGVFRSEDGGSAQGSGFYWTTDQNDAFDALNTAQKDGLGELVDAATQYVEGGLIDTVSREFLGVWFRILDAGDSFSATAKI